jgi:phage tail sheath gpL-like
MSIPVAVSPSVLTPGLYLTVDLLAGAVAPGGGTLRTVIMSPKSAAGDLTADTEVRTGAGEASASTAFGPGTPGHLAAKLVYDKYPAAIVDFIAPTAGAGTATLGITAAGSPTSNQTIDIDICGREWQVAWLSGQTADTVKQTIIDSILERTDDLPVTAVTGGVGIVTVNAKLDGYWGNDVLVKMKLTLAQTGTETLTGAVTHTNLASGSSDPDFTTALTYLAGQEYHLMVPCLSNTDINNVSTANNVSRMVTHIDSLNTGLNAKLQQIVGGSTSSIALAVASALHSNSYNNKEYGEFILCVNGRSLPCEFAAREAGGRLAGEALDPAVNRIGEVLDGTVGSADVIADRPTLTESETALAGGVSIVSYNSSDAEYIVRPRTTHHQDAAGGADTRLIDTSNVSATYIVARDIRTALPQAFPNAKIAEDTVAGADLPPEGVTEERDIKGWIASRMRFWQRQAVLTQASVDAAIDDGTLIVQVNASDATQVDIVIPFKIVPPLAKFGVTVQRQPN